MIKTMLKSSRCGISALAIVFALTGAAALGAPAFGASPAWFHLDSFAKPTDLEAGGEGQIELTAVDVGYENVDGTSVPVKFSDVLPPGFKATGVSALDEDLTGGGASGPVECAVQAGEEQVNCQFAGIVTPYAQIEVFISVKIASDTKSGGINEFSVVGGNVPSASIRRPVALGDAGFGVATYELDPENEGGQPDTQAGSHPFQYSTMIRFNEKANGEPVALAKDLRINQPAGFFGNPTPFKPCTLAQFSNILGEGFRNECPLASVVGITTLWLQFPGGYLDGEEGPAAVPVYMLEPAAGEPARFGFEVVNTSVILDTSVRTGRDYGITVHVNNISQIASFEGSLLTIWGVPGDPRHDPIRGFGCLFHLLVGPGNEYPCEPLGQTFPPPLLSLPTSCTGPLQTSVEADSWKEPGVFRGPTAPNEALQAQDGCNRLPFSPSIHVSPDGQQGSTPTGLTVSIHVPQDVDLAGEGLSEATVKNSTVTLPEGVTLAAGAADGLEACSLEEIGLETAAFPTCPDASKVATVSITTPLLPNPLTGEVYLAAQDANPFGSLVALYIVAKDPVSGTLVKIAGQVALNPVSGQLVATFDNTPQLPFENLEMHFFGGSRAPLAMPASCGTYTTTASIEGWPANPPQTSTSSFQVTSGPNGKPCASPLPFTPTLAAGTTSIQAGGYSPFTMTMSREDGNQNLQGIELHMPEGLSGTLSTVKLCGEAQADAGTCGPESLIGHTTVSVGLGGDPYTVSGGQVFVTGPYQGAPFGLSIVVPAKAGPFNFGTVVVRAKIEVDKTTSALTITTDNTGPYKIPTILEGIPLEIKHVNVSIDRPGFTFNPTNCSPLAITGKLLSTEGATDNLSVPFQITNCAVLAFKPTLTASTSGKPTRADGASLTVKLGYPAGPYDANISKVKVELPKALPSRLPTLQKACTAAQFESNPAGCPPASIIGHAHATTPLIPVPLEGPAYFVSHGNEAFPSLIVVLQGYGVTIDLVGSTFISATGITSSTFKTVPDAPVGTFELTLPQGPYSALAANTNLCQANLMMPTEFVGQNGVVLKSNTQIVATGCKAAIRVLSHTVKGGAATIAVGVPAAGKVRASGVGLSPASASAGAAGNVTLHLALTNKERRFLSHHSKRKLRVTVHLRFTPKSGGSKLNSTVTLLLR